MLLKETLKGIFLLKSNYRANSSIYVLLVIHFLLLLFRCGHAYTSNPCSESMHETTETSNANMRYPKSLTLSPTVVTILDIVVTVIRFTISRLYSLPQFGMYLALSLSILYSAST